MVRSSNQLTLAVIICTRNRKKELDQCLRSLYTQRHRADELVVVDGSDDALRGEILPWSGTEIGIAPLYIASTPGLTMQRNKGVVALRSNPDLICFFDDDVELDPDYLERVVRVFQSDVNHEIVGVGGNSINEKRRNSCDRALRRFFMITDNSTGKQLISGDAGHIFQPVEDTTVAVLSGCNMCFRSSIFFEKALRFDERLDTYGGEDLDFSIRAGEWGKLLQLTGARLMHHVSPGSRPDKGKLFEMYVVSSYYLLQKNLSPSVLSYVCYGWRLMGKLAQAIFLSASSFTLTPLIGWGRGLFHINSLARTLREPK